MKFLFSKVLCALVNLATEQEEQCRLPWGLARFTLKIKHVVSSSVLLFSHFISNLPVDSVSPSFKIDSILVTSLTSYIQAIIGPKCKGMLTPRIGHQFSHDPKGECLLQLRISGTPLTFLPSQLCTHHVSHQTPASASRLPPPYMHAC